MRVGWMSCLLFGCLAWGQIKPVLPSQAPAAVPEGDDDTRLPATASQVPADAAVLTIRGLCAAPTPPTSTTTKPDAPTSMQQTGDCQTIITRAEFDRLADAISPTMTAETKRQLAEAYPRVLVMASKAGQRDLDKTPRFAELLRFARLQILSQEMVHQIQEESAKISDQTIEDYYQGHATDFEQASLERIVIPYKKRAEPVLKHPASDTAGDAQQREAEDAMLKEADALRARAAAGEDFTRLQQAAYDAAGIKNIATTPALGKIRRRGLPAAHVAVFDLKPGEVSQVISDATGYYIYKLDAQQVLPLNAVRNEITETLRDRNMREAMQEIQDSFTTEMNAAYFGDSETPVSRRSQPAPGETRPTPRR